MNFVKKKKSNAKTGNVKTNTKGICYKIVNIGFSLVCQL